MDPIVPAPAGSILELAWLIPVVPAVSAGLLLVLGRRIGRPAAAIAILAVGFAATLSTLVFLDLLGRDEHGRRFVVDVATWLQAGGLDVRWSLLLDPLSAVMLLLVTWVGLLIHVYSLGYMAHDPRFERFFAYLNLFVASMLVLVLGSSFLVLFVVFATFGSLEFAEVLPRAGEATTGVLVAIALLLLVGATGKSAQIPLYVWLPDAMAGPTPVSALIHAATMVTAGVYLVARTSPIFLDSGVGLVVAWIGAVTALVAALIACAQVDLKKILAYSTVSQLGYMFIAVGVGNHTAGVFHLLTHGFFKALLFLAAGSVMHAVHDETDVRRMGGLWRHMPVTAATSLVGVAAISGFPFLSGFYSKEEVLHAAGRVAGGEVLWVIGVVVAALTAFYMTRWFVLIFTGDRRWGEGVHPHESPLSMTLPLVVLAVLSAGGGLLNLSEDGWLHHWLEPAVTMFEETSESIPGGVFLPAALGVALVGALAAWWTYRSADIATIGIGGGPRKAARDRFYVDEVYERALVLPGRLLADGFSRFDRRGIDGVVDGSARLTAGIAGLARRTQTGYVRSYALGVLAGAVLLGVLLGAAFLTGA